MFLRSGFRLPSLNTQNFHGLKISAHIKYQTREWSDRYLNLLQIFINLDKRAFANDFVRMIRRKYLQNCVSDFGRRKYYIRHQPNGVHPKCFTEFAEFSDNCHYSKRARTCHTVTSCVRDQDATTVQHMKRQDL